MNAFTTIMLCPDVLHILYDFAAAPRFFILPALALNCISFLGMST